jgi:hypothetical protein
MIINDLTSANFEVIGVSCPCPSNEVEDSYCINVGKMHERRNEKDKCIFGFDVIGLDITVKNLTLISIVDSDSYYIRILLKDDFRSWYTKRLYGVNEEDVIMQTMLKIGFLKGFVAILSHQISHRFRYNEEYLIDIANMFINRSECDGLSNLLYADWVTLCKEYTQIGAGGLAYIPNPVKINTEHLKGLQKQSIDYQIKTSVGLGHQECTAILLKFKNEVLDNNDEEDTLVL